jgi:AbrB family looped-hinge helix DNA binding protein
MNPKALAEDIVGMTVMGERGQLVIPKDIRDKMKLEPGTRLVAILHDGDKIMLVPAEHLKEFMSAMRNKFEKVQSLLTDTEA